MLPDDNASIASITPRGSKALALGLAQEKAEQAALEAAETRRQFSSAARPLPLAKRPQQQQFHQRAGRVFQGQVGQPRVSQQQQTFRRFPQQGQFIRKN